MSEGGIEEIKLGSPNTIIEEMTLCGSPSWIDFNGNTVTSMVDQTINNDHTSTGNKNKVQQNANRPNNSNNKSKQPQNKNYQNQKIQKNQKSNFRSQSQSQSQQSPTISRSASFPLPSPSSQSSSQNTNYQKNPPRIFSGTVPQIYAPPFNAPFYQNPYDLSLVSMQSPVISPDVPITHPLPNTYVNVPPEWNPVAGPYGRMTPRNLWPGEVFNGPIQSTGTQGEGSLAQYGTVPVLPHGQQG
ncbi:9296_t:CDS:1, partial [Paraglomus occultum]